MEAVLYILLPLYTKDLKKELERGPGTGAEGNVNVSVGPTRHSPAMAKTEKKKKKKKKKTLWSFRSLLSTPFDEE